MATKTKSGSFWVGWANTNAPNSSSVEDLVEPFRSNVKSFMAALKAAGADIEVTATLRPPKRAYLFHWSWKIAVGGAKASDATAMDGVDIEWDHGNATASKKGAREMVNGFGLAVPPKSTNPPSLKTRHIEGKAIDMEIAWSGDLKVKKKDGTVVSVPFKDNANNNTKLHQVGASYDVFKLKTDEPHWSTDGK